jgi:hypothetical protein
VRLLGRRAPDSGNPTPTKPAPRRCQLRRAQRRSYHLPLTQPARARACPPSRLKGSLRRCDVRTADDFDEGEYREATQTLGRTTLGLVKVGLGPGGREGELGGRL